jgi:hypothetical protein
MIGTTAATPAHAQFGGIVYDPTNYAQNVLTAALGSCPSRQGGAGRYLPGFRPADRVEVREEARPPRRLPVKARQPPVRAGAWRGRAGLRRRLFQDRSAPDRRPAQDFDLAGVEPEPLVDHRDLRFDRAFVRQEYPRAGLRRRLFQDRSAPDRGAGGGAWRACLRGRMASGGR